jgi:NADH:ubiquinone oxidoreductase subunit H
VLFARSTNRILSFACLIQFLFLGGFLNSFYVQFLYLCLVVWPVVGERQVRWPAWSVVRNLGRKRQDDMEVAGRQQGGFALGPQRGPADQRT